MLITPLGRPVLWTNFANSINGAGANSTVSLGSAGNGIKLWVDYVYLDTDERRRFAQISHEYLIEQVQFTGDESVTNATKKITLNFNHPCKELLWVIKYVDLAKNRYFCDTHMSRLGPLA